MRGILEHEYGVPHKSVEWFAELDEDVEFTPPPDLKITRLPHDKSVEDMLAEGELDALIHSDIIKPIVDKRPARRRGCGRTTRPRRSPSTRRPASSRSCT